MQIFKNIFWDFPLFFTEIIQFANCFPNFHILLKKWSLTVDEMSKPILLENIRPIFQNDVDKIFTKRAKH